MRDKALRLTFGAGRMEPAMGVSELRLPADRVNVVQITVQNSTATHCRLSFTTHISPQVNAQKMVEFDLRPGASGSQLYTLDLKSVAAWKDRIASLRFVFVGGQAESEIAVSRVAMLEGEKISTPLVYTNFRLGTPAVVKAFRLGSIFNDQMVLQREQSVPVWGRSLPGAHVTVEFAGQKQTTIADSAGRWDVRLAAMPASAESRNLTVTQSGDATEQIVLKDVVVGDVWLCAGQSNMGGSPMENAPPAERRKELLETDYPQLRYTSVPTVHRETPLSRDEVEESLNWRTVQAKNLNALSAVSYFLGQSIHTSQRVPVGLLLIIKAGSQVEQWLSESALRTIFSEQELSQVVSGNHLSSGLHNGMVAPFTSFPIRGALWYQGESNADNEARYLGYYRSLPALVRSWREYWGADLPVLLVQLPAFDGRYSENSWAFVREAQLLASQKLPRVGLAVTIDEGDIKNLHPNNKYFIGSRMGLVARAMVYGEKIECSSPIWRSAARQGARLCVTFDHVADGLKVRGEQLSGFELQHPDGRWLPATARITGRSTVELSHDQISVPAAARYGWSNAPSATLFNSLNLPASPFRTDTPAGLVDAVVRFGQLDRAAR